MTLLGFKTILHKKCRSGKNSEAPAEMKTNFKKSARVGRSELIFFSLLSVKPEIVVSGSGIRFGISFSKFSSKWWIMQFFYLLCSQFRQKASSWINKTLLLVKQKKNGYLTNQNNSITYFEVNCKQRVIFIVLTTGYLRART